MGLTLQTLTGTKADHLAFTQVNAVIRQHSQTFFFATGWLPRLKRQAIRSLYAFCRATDDLVDRANASQDDVAAWRLQVNRPLEDQQDPMLRTWLLTRETFNVNLRYQHELIDGVARDIAFSKFTNWEALQDYCYQVASTVGLLAIPIIGLANGAAFEDAKPYAVTLGIALQLTNILRDVGEDLESGRIYLPKDDLAQFGLTFGDLQRKIFDFRFIALMKFEIARARALFREALPGIALLHRSSRVAVGAAALVYQAILDEIEAIGYQVYDRRAYTSNWRKIQMLPGMLWKIARLKPPPMT